MKQEKISCIGIRCVKSGYACYSYINSKSEEIFKVGFVILPNPDIKLSGFQKTLYHRGLDLELSLSPGTKRVVEDKNGNPYGYYIYGNPGHFKIIQDTDIFNVYSSHLGWSVFNDANQLVCMIERFDENERAKYEEDGFEKETRFKILLDDQVFEEVYPLIFAIPVLGF